MGFHSDEGQGSTFGFFVKTVRVEPPESHMATKSQTIAANQVLKSAAFLNKDSGLARRQSIVPPPTLDTRTTNASKIHILLVEDNLINQRV